MPTRNDFPGNTVAVFADMTRIERIRWWAAEKTLEVSMRLHRLLVPPRLQQAAERDGYD